MRTILITTAIVIAATTLIVTPPASTTKVEACGVTDDASCRAAVHQACMFLEWPVAGMVNAVLQPHMVYWYNGLTGECRGRCSATGIGVNLTCQPPQPKGGS
jgi:hypothetical protein